MANTKKKITKKFTQFRPEVRTRHPSHSQLRRKHQLLPLMPFRSVIRLGSSTELSDDSTHGGKRVELNTVSAIANSADKKRMKALFYENNVPTPIWQYLTNLDISGRNPNDKCLYFKAQVFGADASTIDFPVILKRDFGSRGEGNTKIDNVIAFNKFMNKLTGE